MRDTDLTHLSRGVRASRRALPDNECCRSLDLPRDAISTALVPAARTCTPEGPSENKGLGSGTKIDHISNSRNARFSLIPN
jgi:hypothetical protein